MAPPPPTPAPSHAHANLLTPLLDEDVIALEAVGRIYDPSPDQAVAAVRVATLLRQHGVLGDGIAIGGGRDTGNGPGSGSGSASASASGNPPECEDTKQDDIQSPFVDVHQLFPLYDTLYFSGLLGANGVEVLWSTRLTLCAGICELVRDKKTQSRRVRVKLSEPLLRYRPQEDVLNTLLHELIHAFFFITTRFQHSRPDQNTATKSSNAANAGHGDAFLTLAHAINAHGGYAISVFHTFHDEVDHFRQHVWRCSGPCVDKPPYFGIVKRSMNRPPGRADTWFGRHERECGGVWVKIGEPEKANGKGKAKGKKGAKGKESGKEGEKDGPGAGAKTGGQNRLDDWLAPSVSKPPLPLPPPPSLPSHSVLDGPLPQSFPSAAVPDIILLDDDEPGSVGGGIGDAHHPHTYPPTQSSSLVECPVCCKLLSESAVNRHLDEAHFGSEVVVLD